MRDAKFRVWCEFEINGQIEKCMEEAASWFLLTQAGQVMVYGPMTAPHKPEAAYKKLTPLFYLGRKDRNGREIYEGDILRFCHADDMVVGEDDKESFPQEVQITQVGDFGVIRGEFGDWEEWTLDFAMDSDYVFEVIGNIYENSELLKEG